MSSSAPRFVLHTVADHLNYTAAIDKEDAARLQDILHRRSKHHEHVQEIIDDNNVNNCRLVEHFAMQEKSPFDDNNNSKSKNPANARINAQGQIECNHYKANGYTQHNINNKKTNQYDEQSKSICYLPTDIKKRTKTPQISCTTRADTTTQSRRAHLKKLALPKVNCQCQKLLPRVPVQYRRDGVFDATYTPGIDYDRIVMPRTRVMSALSATYTFEHHPSSSSSSPSSSLFPRAPFRCNNKTQNNKAVHNHKKEFTSHSLQNWNELNRDDVNDVLLASTVEKLNMCDVEQEQEVESYENGRNNNLHSVNMKHTRTPSVFSHSSSFGPITKLGVPHLTSHATAQSVQAHLARLHAHKSRTESTLTAAKLSRHNEMCKHDSNYLLSPHSQKPTPFHEMSTYELSRWLQQVQLQPTY